MGRLVLPDYIGGKGYIIDQFLQSNTNGRADGYGGSLTNRTRLLREVLQAVAARVPAGRVGLRISPTSGRKGMGDENPQALAQAVAAMAQEFGLAYIHLIEAIVPGFTEKPENPVIDQVRTIFEGVLIQNGSFDGATANTAIADGKADAISFGRPFIANPDLVHRIRQNVPLAKANLDYAYIGEEKGYTDYPPYGE